MRRLVCLQPLMLLAAVIPFVRLSAQSQPLKAQVKPPKKVAVLVGTNEYTDRALPSLRFCEADMLALKVELEKAGFKVILLLGSGEGDAEATRQNIVDRLVNDDETNTKYAFRDLTSDDDVAVVAFSGHGQQIIVTEDKKEIETPFYCPKRAKSGVPETLVSLNAVLRGLNGTKAKGLLLVDACRQFTERKESDGQKSAKGLGLDRSVVQGLRKNVGGMFACDDRQAAIEIELDKEKKIGHGAFFQALLTTIRSADGELTWEDVVPQVRRRVKELAGHVKEEDRQKPQSFGSFSAEVVLVPKGLATARKGGEEVEFEIADGVKMTFCWIPPGKATLGSPAAEKDRSDDEKEHEYSSQGFWLGKYEVTQEQWTAVMNTTPFWFHAKGDGKESVKELDTSRFPAEEVSWHGAQAFLKAVNRRGGVAKAFGGAGKLYLPHEAEWEYACRGGKGNKQPFYWGDTLNGDQANCDGNYPYGTTTKGQYLDRPTTVGSYAKSAPHPWGLCDMSGNVWEWCSNRYSQDIEGHVLRGGSCNNATWSCRAAHRDGNAPDFRSNDLGFRVCVILD